MSPMMRKRSESHEEEEDFEDFLKKRIIKEWKR